MDAIFEKYNVKVKLPEKSLLYKKNDAVKLLNLTKEQSLYCQIVLGDLKSESITSINYIGEIESFNDYLNMLKQLVNSNIESGMSILDNKTLKTDNNENLQLLIFSIDDIRVVITVTCFDKKLFMSNTNCNKDNLKSAEKFAVELMKTMSPA